MQTYITHTAAGEVTGYYHDAVHGARRLPGDDGLNPDAQIPLDALEITADQYRDLIDHVGLRRVSVVDGVVAVVVVTPPGPTPEQVQRRLTNHIQHRLDAWAQERGYDSILSAATYATSSVPKFAAEGQAAVAGRDATWAAAAALLAEVKADTRAVPTTAVLDAVLPALRWPS